MASNEKEDVNSSPSTSQTLDPPNGGRTTADSPSPDIPSQPPAKPIPNYLKPTVSSSHHTICHYPKSQQQHPHEPPSHRASPPAKLATFRDPEPEKPSKITPLPAKGRAALPPLKKARSLPLTKAQDDHAKVAEAPSPKSKSMHAKEGDSKKPRTRARSLSLSAIELTASPKKAVPRPAARKVAGGERLKTKKKEEEDGKAKEDATASANEHAARRNKVKAPVGALGTVISSVEPEGQLGQTPDEEGAGDGQRGPQQIAKSQHEEGEESNDNPSGEEEAAELVESPKKELTESS
ncbi:eukaryotic translation initiation factor 5B-like [Canna indica]|uniref:Eukaryotic translation initiation factor 5B-like n=1 Tax=Canna indica TaxID=4628 RepID=A0AAQ3JV66_9LILI|nr:eukaryotic translation initiation factor 5B-like [Canna indica]